MPDWNYQRVQAAGLSSRVAELITLAGRDALTSFVEARIANATTERERVIVSDTPAYEEDVLCRQDARCRVYTTAQATWQTGQSIDLAFNTARYDNRGMWSSSNAIRLTALRAGVYHIGAQMRFTAGAGGLREGNILHVTTGGTRTTIAAGFAPPSTLYNTMANMSCDYFFNAGEYAVFTIYHDKGSDMVSPAAAAYGPYEAWMHYLGYSTDP